MDPFGLLPLEVREMIISNLVIECILLDLCQASPVFKHQLNTSKLLKTWTALHKELDYEMFQAILVLMTYPKIKEPIPAFEDIDAAGCPNKFIRDPLFTPEQHLIFEIDAINQRMAKCFALGPSLVPLYRAKYPDFYGGLFSDYLVKSFGKHGEHLPTTMPSIGSGIRLRIFYILLAIETMEQCPSAFVTGPRESPKKRSIKDERLRRLAHGWTNSIPFADMKDFERFFYKKQE
ncbi:hypothetical protein FGLOB1_4163 [Fusarium globosum]|uniref:Uncharacterized protein n=1 Tax=Fusarium globosum TaxID=78864 RepID=A0A8H5YKU1_9HYPO|nr:hypothetical protein FGLOB1_4163 [Fusarium globosum]